MLTTEGIQTKGGGAHQELLHDQRQFSQISYPKHLLIWRGSAMTDTSLSSRANFYIVTKCFHCVTKKVLFPLNMGNRARQQSCETVLLGVKVGERKGWKEKAERTTAPFSLQLVDMKGHIMSEIRGNYTGSAL